MLYPEGKGQTEAPPPADSRNAAPRDLTRTYADEGIRVRWYAGRCIHSGECIRAAPAVFDPRRRPWIDLAAGDADRIVNAVMRCPTGALEFERLDTDEREEPASPTRVTAVKHGPLFVRGDLEIVDDQGVVVRRCTRVALCRCGESARKPFCDNTHRAIGFRTD